VRCHAVVDALLRDLCDLTKIVIFRDSVFEPAQNVQIRSTGPRRQYDR
jgi:hypothetical protein